MIPKVKRFKYYPFLNENKINKNCLIFEKVSIWLCIISYSKLHYTTVYSKIFFLLLSFPLSHSLCVLWFRRFSSRVRSTGSFLTGASCLTGSLPSELSPCTASSSLGPISSSPSPSGSKILIDKILHYWWSKIKFTDEIWSIWKMLAYGFRSKILSDRFWYKIFMEKDI